VNEDKATRYHRAKRRLSVISLAWGVALLVALLASGLSVAIRSAAESVVSSHSYFRLPLTVSLYVILLMLLNELTGLPLSFYGGFVLERKYGLSTERLSGWLLDEAKSLALGLILGCAGATLLYALASWSPRRWWLAAGVSFAGIIVGLTELVPVVLLPLFYRIKPLARESLRARLVSLAERAGARVLGVYEWGLGDKTRKANAALAGIGATRRILVSDTMLEAYSDDEIEVVLAHELAHHVHGDIWKGILFESALIVGGFYLAAWTLERFAGSLGIRDAADPAGLPLLLLAAGALSFVMVPVAHAMSRAFERSADRFALDLTRNPAAFISAMRRLGAQNLAEDRPSKIAQWLFYSHPPLAERIATAEKSTTNTPSHEG
jgi:STE24 endopeptidase